MKFDDGNFLVEIEPPPGMIAVELHSPTSVGGETTLMLSDEVKASFADDGQSPDREAKDGFYSGFIPGNVKEEILRYESVVDFVITAPLDRHESG
ncbi:MAG: choice-of-anchor X domain-containing protein [Planctomycetota bacterium]